MKTSTIGKHAEESACQYLIGQGLSHVCSNFSCKVGEIDLIMRDQDTLVFVEVRYRKNALFGGAAASIGHNKQQKVRRAAEWYLQEKKLYEKHAVRFDVVAQSPSNTEWITGAF